MPSREYIHSHSSGFLFLFDELFVKILYFRNAQNLRELTIEERCFELEAAALAGISRLDFLSLKGYVTFTNSQKICKTRIFPKKFLFENFWSIGEHASL
jgi:hypothetical protein